ncbi:MAG: transposase [Defluviitaleaceae bacterium]|nr:transposase [Defluviitaleaceae bacterium]
MADIVRRFAPDYIARHGAKLLQSHRRALSDIGRCRTEAMGGHVYHCLDCDENVFVYHGCKNRACPSCHAGETAAWLEKRRTEVLPCGHFHVTVTVPAELHDVFRSNQKEMYDLQMKTAAGAVLTLCRDPRHLGATPGIMSVLHTWSGQLSYHPHVHMLVTAGGVSPDNKRWLPSNPRFLIPVKALSRLVRNRFAEAVKVQRPDLFAKIPPTVWTREWVANILPWDGGADGVLRYLARYVKRIAVTDARIQAIDDQHVTFRYKSRQKNGKNKWLTAQVTGEEFLRRFLQHVLPKGFHKIRYGGLWHSRNRGTTSRIRVMMLMDAEKRASPPPSSDSGATVPPSGKWQEPPAGFRRCPHCGGTRLEYIGELKREAPLRRTKGKPRNRSP